MTGRLMLSQTAAIPAYESQAHQPPQVLVRNLYADGQPSGDCTRYRGNQSLLVAPACRIRDSILGSLRVVARVDVGKQVSLSAE